jgi:hypothetical protein
MKVGTVGREYRPGSRVVKDTALSGAELTPAEAALGPLVRETVWYRTTSLQRHAQRVRPRFSAEEFVEFAGIAALANAVCRLSAVADDR